MPAPVRTPALAIIGLILLIPLVIAMMQGSIAIDAAATRAAILLVVLAVIDRVVLPVARLLIGDRPIDKR